MEDGNISLFIHVDSRNGDPQPVGIYPDAWPAVLSLLPRFEVIHIVVDLSREQDPPPYEERERR